MSLNKEMIFGLLAFGGDNMKWPIVNNSVIEQSVAKNSTYTLDKDVLLLYFGSQDPQVVATSVKIELPDGQVIEEDKQVLSFAAFLLFCPAGTKFTNTTQMRAYSPKIKYYDIMGYTDYNH